MLAAFAIAALASDAMLELDEATLPLKLAFDAASTSASASLSCSCAAVGVRVGCLGGAAGVVGAPKISFIAALSCCSGILSFGCTLCDEAAALTGGAIMPFAFMFASALAWASDACCAVGTWATGFGRMRSARSGVTPASRLIWSLALPKRSAWSLVPSRPFAFLTLSSICLNLATAIL